MRLLALGINFSIENRWK